MKKYIPEVIVGAVIQNARSQVFLMNGRKWGGQLIVPGGHVEFGETLHSALEREIKEETGLSISNIRFVNVDESVAPEKHFVFINYVCTAIGDTITLNSEGENGRFLDLEVAIASNLAAPTRRLLELLRVKELLKEQKQGAMP